jgi:hypothetical protein
MMRILTIIAFCTLWFTLSVRAQEKSSATAPPAAPAAVAPSSLKKSNQRPQTAAQKELDSEPFDTATVAAMAKQ